MKVSELKIGMLLECANDNDGFQVYGHENLWLTVNTRSHRRAGLLRHHFGQITDKIVMYLGTKKDIDIDMPWCDKFVLVDNKIVGVDPASWQRMQKVNESRGSGKI